MSLVLDIIFLVILLLSVWTGVRRGLIRSAAHFLGAILAGIFAVSFGNMVATGVYDTFFRPALVQRMEETIASLGVGDMTLAVQQMLSSLPDFILRMLESAGVTEATLLAAVNQQSGQAAQAVANALSPVFIGFLKVLAIIVLFMLFLFLVRLGANLVSRVFSIPVLSQINGLLGGVFGFLMALLVIWVVVAGIQIILPMLTHEMQADVQNALRQSFIARFFIGMNPFKAIFGA